MGKHYLICIDFTLLMLCLLHPSTQSYNCELSTKNGLYTADCSYRKLSRVPPDLDPSISVLILTGNRIDSWLKTSFVHYPNLKELYINSNRLSYLGFISPIENFTFSILTELEVLDLRNMDLYSWKISLPKTIRVLYLSDNNLKNNPTFTKYANLEILNMSNCNLIRFPMLNEDAPIKLLEFGGNSLNITVADLASFCQLEYLGLDWPMSMASEWCECTKIKNWLEKFQIPSSLTYCPKSYVKSKTCDLKFEKYMIAKFETCKERLPQKTRTIVHIIIMFSILIVVIVLTIMTVTYLKNKPGSRTLDVDNTLRGNSAEPDFEEEFELETEEKE